MNQPNPFSSFDAVSGGGHGPSLDKASAAHAIPAANVPLADFPAPDAPIAGAPAYDLAADAAPTETPDAPILTPQERQMAELIAARSGGANWFFWIVGLSVINTLISLTGTDWGFSLGAAAPQIADYLASESGSMVARVFALGFDVLVFGFYALCGTQAMRGATWAFVLGLSFFALDTVLVAVSGMWIGLALHGWAIFSIFTGLIANCNLKKMGRELATAGAPNPWSG